MTYLQARSDEEKNRRKKAILSAAKDLFYERGYGVPVEEIAARAKLSKATLYLYFKNKDELYVAAIREGFLTLEERLQNAIQPDGSVEESLNALLHAFVDHMLDNRKFFRMTQHYLAEDFRERISSDPDQLLEQEINRLFPYVTQVIERGMDQGIFRKDLKAGDFRTIAWRMATGLLDLAVADESASIREGRWAELFRKAITIILEGARARRDKGGWSPEKGRPEVAGF